MKVGQKETTEINGTIVAIVRKSKYSLAAMVDGKKVATAPSKPKLIEKLEEMFPGQKEKCVSIRSRVIELMNSGEVNSDITAIINAEFPGNKKYDKNHTSWYRSNLVSLELVHPEFSAANMKLNLEK